MESGWGYLELEDNLTVHWEPTQNRLEPGQLEMGSLLSIGFGTGGTAHLVLFENLKDIRVFKINGNRVLLSREAVSQGRCEFPRDRKSVV